MTGKHKDAPDQGLPPEPDNSLPLEPGKPDQGLPPAPDQGLPPPSGGTPDNTLPGTPGTPDNTLPVPPDEIDNALPEAPPRPTHPMDPVEPVDLLAMVGQATKIELVFSDGTMEIGSIKAIRLEASMFLPSSVGLKIGGTAIEVNLPSDQGAVEIVGYALFLDDVQVAWAPRGEALRIHSGSRFNLSDDVVFPG
jgi:hypothetical protein